MNSFQLQAFYSTNIDARKAVLYLLDWFKRLSYNHNCTNYLRNALTEFIGTIE